MSAQTTVPSQPSRQPSREFAAVIGKMVARRVILTTAYINSVIVPAFGLTVGALTRWALGSTWATVAACVPAAVATILAWRRLTFRRQPLRAFNAIDWSTAAEHQRRLAERLPSGAWDVLTATSVAVREHLRAPNVHIHCHAPIGHPYISRVGAGVLDDVTHPVLVVGDQLPVELPQLQYVLAHEFCHLRRPLRLVRTVRSCLPLFGSVLVALLTPAAVLPAAAVALWLTVIALAWVQEITCDIVAKRQCGAGAAAWHAEALRAARATPWQLRLACAVPLTHPPLRLRALYTRVIPTRCSERAKGPVG